MPGCNQKINKIEYSSDSVISKEQMQPRLINTGTQMTPSECLSSVVAISADTISYNSVGSGVCVADNGLIVTNYHVVSGTDKIRLYLADGRICSAKLLWKDKSLDIAILRSDVSLPWLKIAQEGDYSIGEEVYAIGTPLDLNFKHTVTRGVISATNRTLQVDGENGYSSMSHLLQHDASINPGNSGGPLINTKGEIIGINTIKVEDAEGMGFAIVCDTIMPVIKNYSQNNYQSNGYLGVFGYDVSLEEYGSNKTGLKIVSIDENSPSYNILNEGEVILSINNQKVTSYLSLKKALYTLKAGQDVDLQVTDGNKTYIRTVTLAEKF